MYCQKCKKALLVLRGTPFVRFYILAGRQGINGSFLCARWPKEKIIPVIIYLTRKCHIVVIQCKGSSELFTVQAKSVYFEKFSENGLFVVNSLAKCLV